MTKINCIEIANQINSETQQKVKDINKPIKLAVIYASQDVASKKYISLKMQKALEVGIKTDLFQFNPEVKIEEILKKIDDLNKDESVNGILVQLPLYEQLNPYKHRIINSVNPLKDVDGLSAINFGLYSQDIMNGILPATVDACLEVIKSSFNKDFQGSSIVIVNNSDLIGKPLAMILSTLGATVTITNEFTSNITDILSKADIVITATGKGNLFDINLLKDNSVAIDVTSIKVNDKTTGDFIISESNKNIAYTPVPGGIGPLTIACLLRNLVNLAQLQT